MTGRKRYEMARTIDLIRKHTQEYNEYMLKNGKYSFHRFTDGSIHFMKSIFVTINAEETDILPLRPVRELEELVNASMNDDALVTINDYIRFSGGDIILDETKILFCNSSISIEYSGIYSLVVDYNYDLKAILKMVAKGNFGDTVFINGARTSVHDLVLLEQELMYSSCDNEPHTHGVYIKYSDVESIVDIAGYYIFGRVKK
ncbi:MAG: hypothetical protein [Bacteriophage sp.]|nr:MAG: hypothetical protein [Bacteriophage sp.]